MRANLDKNPRDAKSIFNAVAKHYNLMSFLASLGQEKPRRRTTRRVAVAHLGVRALDVAAGTGASAIESARTGAEVVTVDFPQGTIHEGQVRHPELDFQQADAANLKLADNSFGAVAISFGLHNVADPNQALREFRRVLRPGGHLVACEFPHPTWASFQALYRSFLGAVLPPIACLTSSNTMAYGYLTESILAWSSQYQFAMHLRDAGFERLQLCNLTDGIIALHRGYELK